MALFHLRGERVQGPVLACALAGLLSPLAAQAQAVPSLSYGAWSQVYGYMDTSYTSPLLGGTININVNGASDYKTWPGAGSSSGVASAQYSVAAGQSGQDPLYDIVTNQGQYALNYQGQAEVTGAALHTQASSSTWDHGVGGQGAATQVDNAGATNMWSYAQASWNQQFYVAPTATRAAGTYGAILVGIKLDGQFNPVGTGIYNNAWSSLTASTSFVDTAGVSYSSSFSASTGAWDASWTGSQTVYKKLLFQYGTVFNLSMWQYTGVGNNGAADFSHTGMITQIEVPFGATLYTGAGQAGLGSDAELYGRVFNSATADAENTNWDFGNNGGGFTPNVPEPEAWALALAGLMVAGWAARRRPA